MLDLELESWEQVLDVCEQIMLLPLISVADNCGKESRGLSRASTNIVFIHQSLITDDVRNINITTSSGCRKYFAVGALNVLRKENKGEGSSGARRRNTLKYCFSDENNDENKSWVKVSQLSQCNQETLLEKIVL